MIKPIVVALKHHKTAALLVVLEIALTCAIVTNALFVIASRFSMMQLTTGVADDELVWLRSSGLGSDAPTSNDKSRQLADLAALRGIPGVRAAVAMNALPLGQRSWAGTLYMAPGGKPVLDAVPFYVGTPGTVAALGLKLVEGHDFQPADYVDFSPFGGGPRPTVAIVTRDLANRLWPGQSPLGHAFYFEKDDGQPGFQVIGVVEHLAVPRIGADGNVDRDYLLPAASVAGGAYVVRTAPGNRDALLRQMPAVLDKVDDQRVVTGSGTQSQLIRDYFHDDRSLIWLLLAVIGALLALTVLGVVGLSSFWVQQRTRQIGIRRAVGATRRHIRHYFQLENLMIVGLGIALGSLLALLLNLWLLSRYELPRMPLWAVLPGAALLLLIGQLAVLGPAIRASRVAPVVATRAL